MTTGTSAPLLFRAFVESAAFGSKAIIDSFLKQGITIKQVVGIGGISLKSPFIMQTLSNVLGMPIKVAKVEQACALGAAMFAAVASGVYLCIEDAQHAMGKGYAYEYLPDGDKFQMYQSMYDKYTAMGTFTEVHLCNK